MAFLLTTVHVDALPADAQSRFAVAALLFVAVSGNVFFFGRGDFVSRLESLFDFLLHTCSLITEIVNTKVFSTSLFGG